MHEIFLAYHKGKAGPALLATEDPSSRLLSRPRSAGPLEGKGGSEWPRGWTGGLDPRQGRPATRRRSLKETAAGRQREQRGGMVEHGSSHGLTVTRSMAAASKPTVGRIAERARYP